MAASSPGLTSWRAGSRLTRGGAETSRRVVYVHIKGIEDRKYKMNAEGTSFKSEVRARYSFAPPGVVMVYADVVKNTMKLDDAKVFCRRRLEHPYANMKSAMPASQLSTSFHQANNNMKREDCLTNIKTFFIYCIRKNGASMIQRKIQAKMIHIAAADSTEKNISLL